MTTAMRAWSPGTAPALELRVALAHGDRIVDERRLARGEEVTVGASERCTLVVGGAKRVLFARDAESESGFALVTGGTERGRVAPHHGAPALELSTLPAGTRIAIGVGARGRIAIGDATVLFDLVPARMRTRAALPASVKKGLLGDIDWSFTAFVTAALLGCFGFVAVTESADPSIAFDDPATLQAIAHMVVEMPVEPPPAAVVTDPTTHDDPTTPTATPSHAQPSSTHVTHTQPSHSQPSPSLDPTQAADVATIMLVGTLDGEHGAFRDLIRNGAPTVGQAELLAQVTGAQVANNDTTLHARDPGGEDGHDLGHLIRHVTAGPVGEGDGPIETTVHAPPIVIDPPLGPPPAPDPGGFDAQRVIRAIRLRAPQIQACYEHHLLNAPTAAGKVTVGFTVERAGVVSHVEIVDNTADDGTAHCAAAAIGSLRFSPAPSDPADFEFPFVFAPQN